VRATRDLDLNVPPPAGSDLLDELQRAAERDMGGFVALPSALHQREAQPQSVVGVPHV